MAQTVTGFALYSSMSNSWLPQMFNWVVPILGGDEGVRYWHHLFLWFFVSFIIIHVYLAFYHDYIEGRGTISSIVGGWKFEREKSERTRVKSSGPKTLVLGLGNVIMGDEGVGVHVVRALEKRAPHPDVEYLDGGTGGFILLEPMQAAERIIMIDAAADGNPIGTVTRTVPRFSRDYPPTLTAHDIGIKDLLDLFYMLDGGRQVVLYAITIDPRQPITMDLSPEAESGRQAGSGAYRGGTCWAGQAGEASVELPSHIRLNRRLSGPWKSARSLSTGSSRRGQLACLVRRRTTARARLARSRSMASSSTSRRRRSASPACRSSTKATSECCGAAATQRCHRGRESTDTRTWPQVESRVAHACHASGVRRTRSTTHGTSNSRSTASCAR